MPPIIPKMDTPGIIPYVVSVLWFAVAVMTGIFWYTDLPISVGGVLNSGIAGFVASLNMAERFHKTGDFGWLRLSIPFALIFIMALFGYAHYLLLIVAQLAVALTSFLSYRDAQH